MKKHRSYRLTAIRACWYPLMLITLIASLITGRRELFLLFFIMLSVICYSIAICLWTILGFSYTQELDGHVGVKGKTTKLSLGIYNDKPFPFTRLRLRVETAIRSEPRELTLSLLPKSREIYEIDLACVYRGEHKVGMSRVWVQDSFGLVTIPFDMRLLPYYRPITLKVYPRLIELDELASNRRDSKLTGGTARLSEQGESFSEVRRYRPGDSLKRTHRVLSARARELMIKTYDVPVEKSVIVSMDRQGDYNGEDGLYLSDLICECSLAIVNYCLRSGFRVTFTGISDSRDSVEIEGYKDFPRLYETLALTNFWQGASADDCNRAMRSIKTAESIIFISGQPPEQIMPSLCAMAKSGAAVRLLLLRIGGEKYKIDPVKLNGVNVRQLALGEDVRECLSGFTEAAL